MRHRRRKENSYKKLDKYTIFLIFLFLIDTLLIVLYDLISKTILYPNNGYFDLFDYSISPDIVLESIEVFVILSVSVIIVYEFLKILNNRF